MAGQILQINFTFTGPVEDFVNEFAPVADRLAVLPGLNWKMWLLNEQTREGGGFYVFEDGADVEYYLACPIIAELKEHPAITRLSVKQFDVLEDVATFQAPYQIMVDA